MSTLDQIPTSVLENEEETLVYEIDVDRNKLPPKELQIGPKNESHEAIEYSHTQFPPTWDLFHINQLTCAQKSQIALDVLEKHIESSEVETVKGNLNRADAFNLFKIALNEIQQLCMPLSMQLHRYGRIREAIKRGYEAGKSNYATCMSQLKALEETGGCHKHSVYYPQLVEIRDLFTFEFETMEKEFEDQYKAHGEVQARILHVLMTLVSLPKSVARDTLQNIKDVSEDSDESLHEATSWYIPYDTSEVSSNAVKAKKALASDGSKDEDRKEDETDLTFQSMMGLRGVEERFKWIKTMTLDQKKDEEMDLVQKAYTNLLTCPEVMGSKDALSKGLVDEPYFTEPRPCEFDIQVPISLIPRLTLKSLAYLLKYAKLVNCMGYADLRIIRYLRTDPRVLSKAFTIDKELLYPRSAKIDQVLPFPTVGMTEIFKSSGLAPICLCQDYYAVRIDNCYDWRVAGYLPLNNVRAVAWADLLNSLGEGVLGLCTLCLFEYGPSEVKNVAPKDGKCYLGQKLFNVTSRKQLCELVESRTEVNDPVLSTLQDNMSTLFGRQLVTAKNQKYMIGINHGYIVAERRGAGEGVRQLLNRLKWRNHLTGLSNIGLSESGRAQIELFAQACDYSKPDHFAPAGYYAEDAIQRFGHQLTVEERKRYNDLVWRSTLGGQRNALHHFEGKISRFLFEEALWSLNMKGNDPGITLSNHSILIPFLTQYGLDQNLDLKDMASADVTALVNNIDKQTKVKISEDSYLVERVALEARRSRHNFNNSYTLPEYLCGSANVVNQKLLRTLSKFAIRNEYALGLLFERGLIAPTDPAFVRLKESVGKNLPLEDIGVTLGLAMSCYALSLMKFKDSRAAYRLAVIYSRLSKSDGGETTLRNCEKILSKSPKIDNRMCMEWIFTMAALNHGHVLKESGKQSEFWAENPKNWIFDHALRDAFFVFSYYYGGKVSDDLVSSILLSRIDGLRQQKRADSKAINKNNEPNTSIPKSESELNEQNGNSSKAIGSCWWSPQTHTSLKDKSNTEYNSKTEGQDELKESAFQILPPTTPDQTVTVVKTPGFIALPPVASFSVCAYEETPITQVIDSETFQGARLSGLILHLKMLSKSDRVSLLKSYRTFVAEEFGDKLEDGVGWQDVDSISQPKSTLAINQDGIDTIVKGLSSNESHKQAPYLYVMHCRKLSLTLSLETEIELLALGQSAGCEHAAQELVLLRLRILQHFTKLIKSDQPRESWKKFDVIRLPISDSFDTKVSNEVKSLLVSHGKRSLKDITVDIQSVLEDAERMGLSEVIEGASALLDVVS